MAIGALLKGTCSHICTGIKQVVAALRELIVDVAKLLIKDKESVDQIPHEREAEIRRQAQDIVDLEILLANITINDTDRLAVQGYSGYSLISLNPQQPRPSLINVKWISL